MSFLFHTVADLAFVLVGYAVVAYVGRPGRRHHLAWAHPTALGLALTGLYRILIDVHHWFGGGLLTERYVASWALYLSDLIGLYGGWMLLKVLRRLPPTWSRPGRRRASSPRLPRVRGRAAAPRRRAGGGSKSDRTACP